MTTEKIITIFCPNCAKEIRFTYLPATIDIECPQCQGVLHACWSHTDKGGFLRVSISTTKL